MKETLASLELAGESLGAARPTLSIILVTKNRQRFLDRFFRNIGEQIRACDFPCELIVVDGASTDGAIEVIRRHQGIINWWVSEPDGGVSEAFNKALARARGEIIKPVGDEDEFFPEALLKGVSYLQTHPNVDCAIFHAQWMWEEDSGERRPTRIAQPAGNVTLRQLLRFPYSGVITPESAFTRKSVFDRLGGYDTRFHLWAYLEIWLRQVKAGVRLECVPESLMFRIQTNDSDGTKKQASPRWRQEFLEVIRLYGGRRWVLWHRLEGDLRPTSLLLRGVRRASYTLFGVNPRAILSTWRKAVLKDSVEESKRAGDGT